MVQTRSTTNSPGGSPKRAHREQSSRRSTRRSPAKRGSDSQGGSSPKRRRGSSSASSTIVLAPQPRRRSPRTSRRSSPQGAGATASAREDVAMTGMSPARPIAEPDQFQIYTPIPFGESPAPALQSSSFGMDDIDFSAYPELEGVLDPAMLTSSPPSWHTPGNTPPKQPTPPQSSSPAPPAQTSAPGPIGPPSSPPPTAQGEPQDVQQYWCPRALPNPNPVSAAPVADMGAYDDLTLTDDLVNVDPIPNLGSAPAPYPMAPPSAPTSAPTSAPSSRSASSLRNRSATATPPSRPPTSLPVRAASQRGGPIRSVNRPGRAASRPGRPAHPYVRQPPYAFAPGPPRQGLPPARNTPSPQRGDPTTQFTRGQALWCHHNLVYTPDEVVQLAAALFPEGGLPPAVQRPIMRRLPAIVITQASLDRFAAHFLEKFTFEEMRARIFAFWSQILPELHERREKVAVWSIPVEVPGLTRKCDCPECLVS